MNEKEIQKHKNYAFVDGQNLYMGTSKKEYNPWTVNLAKFRIYLAEKYFVTRAFYHLGYFHNSLITQVLYGNIIKAGFILVFRQHSEAMSGSKKGNVDSDIIFSVMKKIYKQEDFENVILVSGDGDYKNLVDFLIDEKRFKKILLPDRKRASSLYKKLGSEYCDSLENIKKYIEKD